ncbi:DUF3626 domain-containing protein, partial [Salmonella enterica]|nr:DUF3626 domain-containing protein [Salmonella enterica]EGS9542903.1 type III secretion system effector SopF [Salmonella enterica]
MLKPICHSGSIKVPEYLETDKEKNAGRTPLSSDIQQVRNVVEDVPPFPESRTVRGSVSAAYRLSFDEVFCGLSNEERKKVYGRLFGKQVLAHIHSRCQRDADIIREKALRRISRECGTEIDCTLLLNKMVDILQNARLTINFNAAKIDFVSLLKNKEYLNSYALGCRPGDLPAYNVGRDSVETKAFELERLADSPYAPYGQTGGFSVAYTPNSRTFSPTSRPIYAALDFLNGENGGASAYGKSFFELNDNVKTNCTLSPFDIYGHRFGLDTSKLSTFWHMENLIASCQNDFFGYNCFKSLVKMAKGEKFLAHSNYGKGYEGNYIEAHIHGDVCLFRDIKHVYLSLQENSYSESQLYDYAKQINL